MPVTYTNYKGDRYLLYKKETIHSTFQYYFAKSSDKGIPYRTIPDGYEIRESVNGSVVLETVRRIQIENENDRVGYNVLSGKYKDMVKDGVIDPAKVTKGALENAASIAAMILTTEALITDLPKGNNFKVPPMPEY